MTEAELARHAERLLAAHALPDGDARVVSALLARCEVRRLGTGEVLFRDGDHASELLFMLEGRARALKRDHAGRDREIGSWFPPALLGAPTVVDGSGPEGALTRSATCIIAGPSLVAALDGETTRRLLGEASDEGAHLRWLLLATAAETLADTTVHLREALAASATDAPPSLDRLQALIERAQS